MKFGICSSINNAEKIKSFGFDYIEFGLNEVVPNPELHEGFIKTVNKEGIKCEIFNCFFPWAMPLVGPNRNLNEITEYLNNSFSIMSKLGGEIAVIGCGGGRRTYEGCTKEQAIKDFAEVVSLAGKSAKPYGIKIAVEALRYDECDVINTIVEAAELARAIDEDNVGMLADWFHMRRNGESASDLLKVSDVLFHVHIASTEGRNYPMENNADESQYKELFGALKQAGYDKRISIEGSPVNSFEEDGPISAKYLKSYIL